MRILFLFSVHLSITMCIRFVLFMRYSELFVENCNFLTSCVFGASVAMEVTPF